MSGIQGSPSHQITNNDAHSYAIGQLLNGSSFIEKDVDAEIYRNMESSNITIRVKGTSSNNETTLFSFGDKNSTRKINLRMLSNGKLQLNTNYGGNDEYYTCSKVVGDNRWHTLSLNLEGGKATLYVDGEMDREVTSGIRNFSLNQFNVNSVTIGAYRDVNHRGGAGFFSGVIDYMDVYDHTLTQEEVREITPGYGAVTAASVIAPYTNNSSANTWMFVGGATTEGINREISTKNYLQLFDEIIRVNYNYRRLVTTRFALNQGKTGMSSADLVSTYEERIAKYSSDVVIVTPDIKNEGRLVESSPQSFKQNLEQLRALAVGDGRTVIFMTPASVDDDVAPYVSAMKELANQSGTALIDVYSYFRDIQDPHSSIATLWFENNGIVNETGHLMVAKYMMNEMGINQYTINYTQTPIFGLKYIHT